MECELPLVNELFIVELGRRSRPAEGRQYFCFMTKHWFTCKVKYVRHDAEGAEVKATESFVLDAYNYTEAESRMTGICEQEGIRPFEIVQITKSNLVEVIRFDDADQWFKVKIALTSLDEKAGKEKESYQHILSRQQMFGMPTTRCASTCPRWALDSSFLL